MGPGYDIASSVQAQKEQDQGAGQGQRSEVVDSFQRRLFHFGNGDLNAEEDHHRTDYYNGYLHQKCHPPSREAIDPTTQQPSDPRTGTHYNVPDALQQAPLPQRYKIASDEHAYRDHCSTSQACDGAARDEDAFARSHATEQGPQTEDEIAEQKTFAAAENIGEAAAEGLSDGLADEVS